MDGTAQEEVTPEPIDDIGTWDPKEYLRKRVPQAQYARRSFDRGFYRNCLFYLGQQWIRYSRSAQQWRPIAVPDWFPKQVTNKFAVAVDMMRSVFMQSDPQSVYSPASADPEDVAAAHAAMDISKLIDLEVNQSELESKAAAWIVLTGNAFVIDGYDKDPKHGTKFLPDMACMDCIRHVPAEMAAEGCAYCGGQNLIEARDEKGEPIGQDFPIGKMFSEVASPFEMHFDLVAGSIEESPYVYRARTYPVEVIKDMFPEHKDAIKADDAGSDSGMFYQTALSYITNGSGATPGNYGGSSGSIDNVPRATLYHLWVRPTNSLAKGGEALVCGDATLWKGPLSFHDEQEKPIVPVTHFGFNTVPGRIFYKTPADDLVFKQVQHNKIEAFIQLAMERTSNPTWLLPKGIGIDNITGEPGEKIWFSALAGLKPERVGGSEIPGSVFRWMTVISEDIQDLSHTRDVMRGKPPEGVPTLGGTQLLLERGLAGYADGLKSWGRGWNTSRRYRLLIWREHATDERTMMVLGPNREWEAKKFSKDALGGRINVYLEEASIAPKSKAYDQLITAQLIDKNMVDMQDPAVKVQVMHIYDSSNLIESLDLDIKDAVREKEDFMKTSRLRPRSGVDNDQIHLTEHLKVSKSDEFWRWPPQAQQMWTQHIAYHRGELQKAAEAAQANDPHMINARAKMQEVQMELAALAKEKQMDLEHHQKRKEIDLHAHGIKKGVDAAINAAKVSMAPTQKGA